jgi:hypothetical protein
MISAMFLFLTRVVELTSRIANTPTSFDVQEPFLCLSQMIDFSYRLFDCVRSDARKMIFPVSELLQSSGRGLLTGADEANIPANPCRQQPELAFGELSDIRANSAEGQHGDSSHYLQ